MSTLHVENLKGLTSGGNANKVIIPTGQTLEVTDNIRYDDMPAGSVIQQVSSFSTTLFSTTSSSFSATHSSVSITPKFANSQMSIWVSASSHHSGNADYGRGQIRKNGSAFSNYNEEELNSYLARTDSRGQAVTMCYCDTNVGTTSSVTYAYYLRTSGGTAHWYRNNGILVQEIKV